MSENNPKDLFQIGLLVLIILTLFVSVGLFFRMNRFQTDTLARLQQLESAPQVEPSHVGLQPGDRAPAFRLTTSDNHELSLHHFAESVLLMVFVTTECDACERVYPVLRRLDTNHANLQILMVSDGSIEDVHAANRDNQLNVPVVAWEADVAQAYKVSGTPFFTVVDGRGLVTASGFVTTGQYLESLLATH